MASLLRLFLTALAAAMSFSTPTPADNLRPANVAPEKLDTNQQTRALPWFAGADILALTWIIPQPLGIRQTRTSSGGKSGKSGAAQTNTYCSVAGVVCCGPVDLLKHIEVNGDLVWSGELARDESHPEHSGDLTIAGVGTFRLHWGTETAAGDWLFLDSTHPYYRGQVVLEVTNLNCGSGGSVPNIRVRVERSPRWESLDSDRNLEGANPVTAVAELIADDFFGLGQPTLVDETLAYALAYDLGWRSATVAVPGNPTHTASMSYCSPYLRERQTFGAILAAVFEHFDGWARRAGEKLELGRFDRPGAIPEGLATLSLHDLTEDPEFPNPGPDDPSVKTDAIVNGRDRDRYDLQDTWQMHYDEVARARCGERRPQTYARPFLTTSYQLKEQAQQLAAFYSEPAASSTIKVRRARAAGLFPGDRFLLNYEPSALERCYRITRRADPARGSTVELTIEPERGLSPAPYLPPLDPVPDLPDVIAAETIVHARALQLPVTFPGLTALPTLVTLAARPSAASSGYQVHFSVADSTYDHLADVTDWALYGTLASGISSSDLVLTLNASGADTVLLEEQSAAAASDNTLLLVLGDEILSVYTVTALGGGQYELGVLRGRLGSTAASHSGSAAAYVIRRADLVLLTHAELPRTAATRYLKLADVTPGDVEDLSTALKLTLGITDTRPASPTGLLVTGGKSSDFNRPPVFVGSFWAQCLRVNWQPPVNLTPGGYYEWVQHSSADTDADAEAVYGPLTNSQKAKLFTRTVQTEAILASPLLVNPTYFRVRFVDFTGYVSPWANAGGSIYSSYGYPFTSGTVGTIADLKALSVSGLVDGFIANVLGYYAAGDGGGGQFRYVASSTDTDNGGTTIQPTSGSGRWRRVINL